MILHITNTQSFCHNDSRNMVKMIYKIFQFCCVHCAVMHRHHSCRRHGQLPQQAFVFEARRTNRPVYLNRSLHHQNQQVLVLPNHLHHQPCECHCSLSWLVKFCLQFTYALFPNDFGEDLLLKQKDPKAAYSVVYKQIQQFKWWERIPDCFSCNMKRA